MSKSRIHPSAIVERHAELGEDVEIGPFCHVHAGARIGSGTRLISHAVVMGNTVMGASNVVHPFAVIGGEAQIRKGPSLSKNDGAHVHARVPPIQIGDHNVFRESVTVNASSGGDGEGGTTRIGAHNLFMAGCHIAHDVAIGSRCVVANGVQLAGHVVVEDWVTFGGLSGVAQHLHVGESTFVAAGAMCERDVPPFVIVQGDRARVRALNIVGLTRRGVPEASIAALRKAVTRLWFGEGGGVFDEELRELDRSDAWVARLVSWLEDPMRAMKPAKRRT